MADTALPIGTGRPFIRGAPLPIRGQGLLRVVSGESLAQQEAENARLRAEERRLRSEDAATTQLAAYIRGEFEAMRNHRGSFVGWNQRLLRAQRMFNGEYDAQKLADIKKFGGSQVYTQLVAIKCRGASSLLREVYLGPERPWGLDPSPKPKLPDTIASNIQQLVSMEMQAMTDAGKPIDLNAIRDRVNLLNAMAQKAARVNAAKQATSAERELDDRLVEGNFYKALAEFLVDLPLFPFACIKGPVVRVVPDVVWGEDGTPVIESRPKMFWQRVSPFDIFFSSGVSAIEDAAVIERTRLTRADLNEVIDLPGYNALAVRAALQDYGRTGLHEWMDPTDQQRADGESRESPQMNRSNMIDCLEFHGNIQGALLREWGMSAEEIPDPDRDYFVQAWLVGRHVIKVQFSPSPRKRHPYYITSFEKVPGTVVGNALPDRLGDIEDVANATLRALVNNLSISSGPQVVVHDDRLAPGENGDDLFPWKRWHVVSDPMNASQSLKPVEFFQPPSNAPELLGIYEKLTLIADELSAIPRYATGSDRLGGAARTSSGLAMLMGNASKVLQTVAANIDRDVFQPCLENLYDLIMLTDTSGLFRGDESIRVRGVDVAVQRETSRQRAIEFLTATANPMDMGIMGVKGRANVLRTVADDLKISTGRVVPDEEELEAVERAQKELQANGVSPAGPSPPNPENTEPGVQEGKAMRSMVQ